MKCDIEARELGLSEEERAIIDDEIKQAKEEDKSLQDVMEKARQSRDELKQLREEKKDYLNTTKENKAELEKIAQKASEDGQTLEDLNKLYKRARELSDKIKSAKESKARYNEEYKQDVDRLASGIRALRNEAKSIRDHIKETRKRVIQKALDENFEGARKTFFQTQAKSNPKVLVNALDQMKISKNNLWSTAQGYTRQMLSGIEKHLDGMKGFENDLDNEDTKGFISHIRRSINSVAKSLGIEEKYAFTDDLEHPVALSNNVILRHFFTGFFKAKAVDAKAQEFLDDWLNSVGIDEVKRVVNESYMKIDGYDVVIPSPKNAVREMVQRYAEGKEQILHFGKMKFKSHSVAKKFIEKYTEQNISANYLKYLVSVSKRFSASKISGGYIDDHIIKAAKDLTDKDKTRLRNYRDLFFKSDSATSASVQRWLLRLSGLNTVIASSRAITLMMSPIGDHIFGKTALAMKYARPGNILSRALEVSQELVTGGALKYGFKKQDADNMAKVLQQFNMHTSYRFGESLGAIPGSVLDKINTTMISFFENVDSGLRVATSKDFARLLKDNHMGDTLEDMRSSNIKLYKSLTDEFDLNSEEWEKIKESLKDNDLLVSSDFKGDLAMKVAAMEHFNNLAATPVGIKMPSGSFMSMAQEHPLLAKTLSMFWSFTMKLAYFGFKGAFTNSAGGRFAYLGTMMLGGFLPNLVYEAVSGLVQGKSLDSIFSDKGTYVDALLGPFGRLFSVGSALVGNPSQLFYSLASPSLSTGINISQAASKWAESAINQDNYDNAMYKTAKALMSLLPVVGYSPLRPYILHHFNSSYKPGPDADLQQWIKEAS